MNDEATTSPRPTISVENHRQPHDLDAFGTTPQAAAALSSDRRVQAIRKQESVSARQRRIHRGMHCRLMKSSEIGAVQSWIYCPVRSIHAFDSQNAPLAQRFGQRARPENTNLFGRPAHSRTRRSKEPPKLFIFEPRRRRHHSVSRSSEGCADRVGIESADCPEDIHRGRVDLFRRQSPLNLRGNSQHMPLQR